MGDRLPDQLENGRFFLFSFLHTFSHSGHDWGGFIFATMFRAFLRSSCSTRNRQTDRTATGTNKTADVPPQQSIWKKLKGMKGHRGKWHRMEDTKENLKHFIISIIHICKIVFAFRVWCSCLVCVCVFVCSGACIKCVNISASNSLLLKLQQQCKRGNWSAGQKDEIVQIRYVT